MGDVMADLSHTKVAVKSMITVFFEAVKLEDFKFDEIKFVESKFVELK